MDDVFYEVSLQETEDKLDSVESSSPNEVPICEIVDPIIPMTEYDPVVSVILTEPTGVSHTLIRGHYADKLEYYCHCQCPCHIL